MAKTSIIIGILLIILGVGSYLITGGQSVTAFIPAFFGILILLAGLVARNERWRKHAMHAALLIAVLGLIGSFSGIPKTITLISGGDVSRPAAVIAQAVMALICIVYLVLGIKSFIDARRQPGRKF